MFCVVVIIVVVVVVVSNHSTRINTLMCHVRLNVCLLVELVLRRRRSCQVWRLLSTACRGGRGRAGGGGGSVCRAGVVHVDGGVRGGGGLGVGRRRLADEQRLLGRVGMATGGA